MLIYTELILIVVKIILGHRRSQLYRVLILIMDIFQQIILISVIMELQEVKIFQVNNRP